MAKTLEKLVKERQKQAKKKKLYEKADLIARCLGSIDNSPSGSVIRTVVFGFKNEDFVISGAYTTSDLFFFERRYNHISVHSEGGTVFSAERRYHSFFRMPDEINSYIPGLWEGQIDSLYNVAKEKEREAREKMAREDKGPDEAELRRKFGL